LVLVVAAPLVLVAVLALLSDTELAARSESELVVNRAKWLSAGIDSYAYTAAGGPRDNSRVVVENGHLVSSGRSSAYARGFDDMFEHLEDPGGHRVEVEYDERYGFPTRIHVDPEPVTDDEYSIVIYDFTVTE
jgi:hypothetical protein